MSIEFKGNKNVELFVTVGGQKKEVSVSFDENGEIREIEYGAGRKLQMWEIELAHQLYVYFKGK